MRTILQACLLGLSLLSITVAGFSQQVAKTIPNSTSPDGLIGFLEFRPSDYGSQKHPLIIFLHGIGERGNGTTQINSVTANAIPRYCANGASMRFTVNGQTSSFVVLSPQLSLGYGYWPTFYVKEMINYAKANLQIDPNRIYVTGLSLGGGGVWRAITEAINGDYSFDAGIAAAAPVCGTQEESDYDFCSTIGGNHLPVWAFHSMDDNTVNVASTLHAQSLALACGLSPAAKFTFYQTGDHSGAWIHAYDTGHITTIVNGGGYFTANPNLYEWFLSNTRNSSTPTYTAPVANAGVAQSITLPLNTVTLTGTGTGTNGATITSYSWTKTSGPNSGTISLPLLNTTLVTGLVQGTYVFTLTVTDNHGLSSNSNVTVTVNPLFNQAPVSNAGSNASVTLPVNSITLDGSASYDPDGTIAAYYWTQISGPSSYTIADPTAVKTTLSNLTEGNYEFQLQVRDNAGVIGMSSVFITVNPNQGAVTPPATPNQAPVSNAGSNSTLTLPTNSIALDGSASYDPDGSIAAYYWVQISGPSSYTIADPAAMKTTVSNLVQGNYEFQLQVRDNAGVIGLSSVFITVNPGQSAVAPPPAASNQAPVSNAGSNTTLTLPTNSIALDGSASYDPDGSIAAYYWVQISGPSSSAIADPAAIKTTANNLVQGNYEFQLQVRDDAGTIGLSSVFITVNPAPVSVSPAPPANNQAPVSNAGSNSTLTLPTNSVALDGSASYDADGSIVAYYWVQISGPSSYAIADPTAMRTTVSNLVQGNYEFQLQVKDNGGLIGLSSVFITVINPAAVNIGSNQAPVSNAGSNSTLTLPTNSIALDGSASYDPDGIIAAYYWVQISGPSSYTIADPTAVRTTVSNLVPGSYEFQLQVRDNGGTIGLSSVFITVLPAAADNQAPISYAGADVTLTLPANSVSLDAGASFDPDGSIAAYYWVQISGPSPAAIADPAAAQTTANNLAQGVYVFQLQVRDNMGVIGYSSKTVTVNPGADASYGSNSALVASSLLTTTTLAQALSDSALAVATPAGKKLSMYPNPVRTTATLELYSADNSMKTINVFYINGVLKGRYLWPVAKGKNTFSLRDIAGFANGLYIIDIRDDYGKSNGKLKFVKM